jgi:excisionase family DNA binding protein
MNIETPYNPFADIFNRLDKIENLLLELKQSKKEDAFKIKTGVELAERLTGYSRHTIYKMVQERAIPHSKTGNRLHFDEKELREWLANSKRLTIDENRRVA